MHFYFLSLDRPNTYYPKSLFSWCVCVHQGQGAVVNISRLVYELCEAYKLTNLPLKFSYTVRKDPYVSFKTMLYTEY